MPLSDRLPPSTRTERRQAIRRQLETIVPGLRLVADDVLAEASTVDLVGVDSHGRAVLVLIADHGEDLASFTRALAARAWVNLRVRDWAQLAPALKLRPAAGVRALLVCSSFDPDTAAAALSLGSEGIELVRYDAGPGEHGSPGRIEFVSSRQVRGRSAAVPRLQGEASTFRSGLDEEDLGLSPEEIREFD